MGLIQWNNCLELGNLEIDGQHKTLVEALNNFHSAILRGEGRSEVVSTSKFLLDYAASHFAMEEKMMDSQAYPGLSYHKNLHVNLIADFTKMINGFEWGSSSLTIAVLVSLEEWVTIHFMNEDAKFVNFINK
jgi:hemerythrin